MNQPAAAQHRRRPWRSILAATAAFAFLATASYAATREWATLQNCVLVQNPANDGDSFHVMHDGKEYVFRLYFVDCPEEDDRYSDRVAAQAAYFGVNEKQAHALAEQAAAFTPRPTGQALHHHHPMAECSGQQQAGPTVRCHHGRRPGPR